MNRKPRSKDKPLVIGTWPQLRRALDDWTLKHLGDTPEEVARFLIIEGLEKRRLASARNSRLANNR